jgi:O-antigen/teichoic acid export membrane protein
MKVNLAQAVLANTLWQVAARIVTVLVGVATVWLTTRYLGPDGYGRLAVVVTLSTMLVAVADVGLSTILPRELARASAGTEDIAGALLRFRLVSSAVFVAIAALIAPLLPYEAEIKMALIIALVGAFFLSVGRFPTAFFQVNLRMQLSGLLDVSYRAVALALTAIVVVVNAGFYAVVLATTLASVCWALGSFALSRRFWTINVRFTWSKSRRMLTDSVAMWGVTVIGLLHFKADLLILAAVRPATDVGIYALGYAFIEQALFLPGFLMAVVFPIIVRGIAQGTESDTQSVVAKAFEVLVLVGVAVNLFLFFAARPLIEVVSNSEFVDAATVLQVVSFSVVPFFANAVLFSVLVALNRRRALLGITTAAVVLNSGLNLLLIPKYGYMAAAVLTVATETFGFVLYLFSVRRTHLFVVPIAFAGRAGFATLIGVAVGVISMELGDAAAASLAVSAFIAGLFATRVVTLTDARFLVGRSSEAST